MVNGGTADPPGLPAYRPRPGTIPTLHVPDATGWRRLHLVGIGGAGMSGLALLLLARGFEVSGSDLKESRAINTLQAAGATVFVGHHAEHIRDGLDAVVVSSAIPPTNIELHRAREMGISVLTRAQVLAALMRGFRRVAVSGTHGKTTTTSMVSVVLSRCGIEPTFVIGGDLNESGSGAGFGSGGVFVAEADESDGSFLLLEPEIAVVTNIEEDHLDFYADRGEVEAAFRAFASKAGTLVACWDDPGVRRALGGLNKAVLWYGMEEGADLRLLNVDTRPGSAAGVFAWRSERVEVNLSVPGRHNLLNAGAALGAAVELGVPVTDAAAALRFFSGVRRRFERRGEARGAIFVDDYAHHPSEIAATLATARIEATDGRVVAVFQPHRYTRTRAMWRLLGESLETADFVVLTDVYSAGEDPIPGVTGKLLVDALAEARPGKRVVYLPHRMELAPFLAREVRPGDVVLTLGAGDVTMVGEETLRKIRAAETGS